LGGRASAGAKLFLLSVAIVDDIIAILVIALFYSTGINPWWLAIAAVGVLAAVALRRLGVVSPWGYVPLGVLTWVATFESGVHATLVGVAFGLLTPAHPVGGRDVLRDLEETLHPVSAFLVIPMFALANAGVDLRGGLLGEAFTQQLTWAVIAGLILGKIIGIAGVTHLVRWRHWGALPADMHPREIIGVAALGGIGFTVSLFITELAFDAAGLISQAKVGILTASAAAALIGTALLLRTPAGASQRSPEADRDRVDHGGA
jgi:NhaA family Na+:H+ antiporter